ncbi:MAG TPA: MEDS domain-containing protein, partial [Kofleriaceae bacterium]
MAATTDGWAELLREPQRHIAQLYKTSGFLADAAGRYLSEGARRGEIAIVIATPEHSQAIRHSMQQHGVQPDELFASGRLVLCDAATTLASFMRDGKLDRALAEQELGGLLSRLGANGSGLRAYGEMVMLLWRAGDSTAAIELEQVWNGLVEHHRFSLLCGYHLDGVSGTYPAFAQACREHRQVLPSEHFLAVPETERLNIVAHLEQEALEAQARERFIRTVVDSSHDCIKVLDLQARLLLMNKGGMAVLELCDFELARGQCWFEFWTGADRIAAETAVAAAREGRTSEFVGYFETMVTKQPRWWHVVVSPILDSNGAVQQILAVSHDVTDRRRLEQDLRRSIEARDQFLSIASHELRTPITSLSLQLELARVRLSEAGTLSSEKLNKLIELSTRQVERLTTLVESMLGVSELNAGKLTIEPRAVNLSQLVTAVLDRFRDQLAAAGSPVTLDLAPDVEGHWDAGRLEQVVENLLVNITKYARGAAVTLSTQTCATDARL